MAEVEEWTVPKLVSGRRLETLPIAGGRPCSSGSSTPSRVFLMSAA